MKKALIIALSIITLPFEAVAFLIARVVKMQGWEDVQSPAAVSRQRSGFLNPGPQGEGEKDFYEPRKNRKCTF